MPTAALAYRARVLRAHGATGAQLRELLAYTRNHFDFDATRSTIYPLPDEPCVAAWREYEREATSRGVFPVLRERLVQLRFPIAEAISRSEAYRAAVRRGDDPPPGMPGIELRQPAQLRLFVHPTPAGAVPVLVVGDRADFVALARALAHRNEPVPIPDALGALTIAGLVNWDRLHKLRRDWERTHAAQPWSAELRRIAPQKELYQDRLLLLSAGPYSATPGWSAGYPAHEWLALSLRIRLEHECTHYFTRRLLGSMRNALLDEIIADYVGIASVAGAFRADWFLRFFGLEHFPAYRPGGRLEHYRGDPLLSDGAFRVLQAFVRNTAQGLERLDRRWGELPRDYPGRARRILALARLGCEPLAGSVLGALSGNPLLRRRKDVLRCKLPQVAIADRLGRPRAGAGLSGIYLPDLRRTPRLSPRATPFPPGRLRGE